MTDSKIKKWDRSNNGDQTEYRLTREANAEWYAIVKQTAAQSKFHYTIGKRDYTHGAAITYSSQGKGWSAAVAKNRALASILHYVREENLKKAELDKFNGTLPSAASPQPKPKSAS